MGRKTIVEIPTIIVPAACATKCMQQIRRNGESTLDLTSMSVARLSLMYLPGEYIMHSL